MALFVAIAAVVLLPAGRASADDMACPYPMTGFSVKVQIAVEAGGGFCDGPTEINGSHWHCEFGGAVAGGGGIALTPIQGFTIGGIASGGIGGGGKGCSWRCPDSSLTTQPNPPGAWRDYLVVRPANNSCRGHMTPAGPTSQVVEPDQGPPGYQPPDLYPPVLQRDPPEELLPTVTNPGEGNPDALG